MNWKKLIIIVTFLILVGISLAPGSSSFAEAERPCSNGVQAGEVSVTLSESNSLALAPISFAKSFCEFPIVIATGRENVTLVQIGVVTTQVAWLLVHGQPGDEVTVFWQAVEPTQ